MVDGGMVPCFSVKKINTSFHTHISTTFAFTPCEKCLSPESSHLENEVALIRCVTCVLF